MGSPLGAVHGCGLARAKGRLADGNGQYWWTSDDAPQVPGPTALGLLSSCVTRGAQLPFYITRRNSHISLVNDRQTSQR